MKRLLAALCLVALPVGAAAQAFLAPPSIGEALRSMDRLRTAESARGLSGWGGRDLQQTYVLPERPGQNQVAWYDFRWQHYDVPSPSGGQGGIRLYFYRGERQVAERALPVIRDAYLRMVDQFHYTPTRQIPYILYSSQREFQTTNVFAVNESVLGVTSPRDLKMSLPYFGNHELFREVSTHELVHQFHIQKMLDLAGGDVTESAMEALPLWFTEGIAEYYSKGGLDPEADLYLRDLVWNPDPEHHYEVVAFQDDRIRGYIPTYKLGQARIAFIAEVYGKEKIQSFLENASLGSGPGERGFAALTRRVLNEPLDQVDARWRAWLKRRYYTTYTATRQDLPQVRELRELKSEPEAFAASPDGTLIFYRGIDRDAGRASLYLADVRDPGGAVEIATDNRPGVESLHPIERSVMAITDGLIAFAAQDGPGDVLYTVPFAHTPPALGTGPRIRIGSRRRLPLAHPTGDRFIEIADPTFSPDGQEIAFAALAEESGMRDIYVVSSRGGTARRLTHDAFAESDLAWGKDGIYYSSDATDHGRFNLFRIDPSTGARTRLTTGNWNDRSPSPLADGSVLFSSSRSGKPDLYLYEGGATRRLTDFTTGLGHPAAAPRSRGAWAGTFYRGRFRVVEVSRVAWLDEPALAVAPPGGPVLEIPQDRFPDHTPYYDPYALRNWRPEAGIVYGGGASSAVAGRAAVLFSDLLRDRLLYLDLAVYGSFDFTQGLVLYEDRANRTARVLGAYHYAQQQLDRIDPTAAYFQRDFGVLGALRFPLDRFRRLEVQFSLGAVQRYCLTDFGDLLRPIECGRLQQEHPLLGDWRARNGGVNPELGPTLRYGYDTVRFDPFTGPISGDSLLLEVGGGWLPLRSAIHGFVRGDAARWWRLFGRLNFMLRAAAGRSFAPGPSRTWARSWWVSAADNLRGYDPFDVGYLVGQYYYVVNAELQFPLDPLVRLAIFDHLEGVAAFDFGGVFNRFSTAPGCAPESGTCPAGNPAPPSALGFWDSRTLTGVLGLNVLFGPLLLRLHFGHPFDIGGVRTPALQTGSSWVTNITLRYFFF
jgi:hypothetical protein